MGFDWTIINDIPDGAGDHPHPQDSTIAPSAQLHETACIDTPCTIGARSQVWHFSHIMPHTIIGDDCHIAQHVTIYGGVMLGNGVRILENTRLSSGTIVEDNATCGPNVSIITVHTLRAGQGPVSKVSPTVIRTGAVVGANCSVAHGTTIGKHAFVEANTVVDANIPNHAIVRGNPYTVLGWRCHCGETLAFTVSHTYTHCRRCNTPYHRPTQHRVQAHTLSA